MYSNCAECRRLWQEYSEATHTHLGLVGKVQLAEIEQNSSLLKELRPLKFAADEQRGKSRLAFKTHEASHNGKPKEGV